MKKVMISYMILITVALCLLVRTARAEAMPLSSAVFIRTAVGCTTTGSVRFTAQVSVSCDSISVTSCTLERKVGGDWVFSKYLNPPESKSNTYSYWVTKNYSSELTRGNTYRIIAVFEANGESVTKISNTFTY